MHRLSRRSAASLLRHGSRRAAAGAAPISCAHPLPDTVRLAPLKPFSEPYCLELAVLLLFPFLSVYIFYFLVLNLPTLCFVIGKEAIFSMVHSILPFYIGLKIVLLIKLFLICLRHSFTSSSKCCVLEYPGRVSIVLELYVMCDQFFVL